MSISRAKGLNRSDLTLKYNTYIWSVALYGSETWTLRNNEERVISFETWCWRRMLKQWIYRIMNAEVFQRAKEERMISFKNFKKYTPLMYRTYN